MFKVIKTEGRARRGEFQCAHGGVVQTPVFMNVGTRMAVRAECGSLPVAAAVGLGLYGIVWAVGLAAWQTAGFRWDVTAAVFGGPLLAGLLRPGKAKKRSRAPGKGRPAHRPMRRGAL